MGTGMGTFTEFLDIEKYKTEIHRTLISKLDLEKLSRVEAQQARKVVASLIDEIIRGQGTPLSFDEQARVQAEL